MRYFLNLLIDLVAGFFRVLSPLSCRFSPSCSAYAKEALKELGIFKGSFVAMKRILKCHPFHQGGYDPVPGHAHE